MIFDPLNQIAKIHPSGLFKERLTILWIWEVRSVDSIKEKISTGVHRIEE
jgi:hypothetical protein